MQGSPEARRSAVGSGILTGVSTAAVSGSAAVAGAILSRKFGHGVKTDGFFAAFAAYVAPVLVATALPVVVLVAILALVGHGVQAFGWGLALNGVVSLAVPLAVLVTRGGIGLPGPGLAVRLRRLAEGVALPFARAGLYVIGYRFASGLGEGRPTTFSYAYLIAALLVAVTASSLALVSSVPLARHELTPDRAGRHVVAASWLSLAVVGAAAGVFALAGEHVARWALGPSYGGGTGSQLGRLVVYLAPWMVASVAVSVAFPLLFVRGSARFLPLLAVGVLALHVLVEWGGRAAFGLAGIAAGMAVTTTATLAALLWPLGSLVQALRGLLVAALVCGGLAVIAFGAPRALVGAVPAAVIGLVLYAAVLATWRPVGLRAAWTYARTLR